MYKYKCCKHHHNIEHKERKQFDRKVLQSEYTQWDLELALLEEELEIEIGEEQNDWFSFVGNSYRLTNNISIWSRWTKIKNAQSEMAGFFYRYFYTW